MSFLFLFRSSYRAATQPKLTELKKFTLFAPRAPRRGSSEAAILANKLTIIVHRAPTARADRCHRGIQSAYGAPRLGTDGAATAAAAAAARSAAPYAHRSAAADAECTTGAT